MNVTHVIRYGMSHVASISGIFCFVSKYIFRQNQYIYICLSLHIFIVDFNALAQASEFDSKGDKLSSSAECRIWSWEVWDTKSPADWMPTHKPTELSRIEENLNSTARPYNEWTFSPLDFTADWLSHLALAIYMLVVVIFDALAQANDIQITRRQVVFLCWIQDSKMGPPPPPTAFSDISKHIWISMWFVCRLSIGCRLILAPTNLRISSTV